MLRRYTWIKIALTGSALFVLAACGTTTEIVERVVEVPVEKIVTREVIKEVPVDRVVTKEVEKIITKEVPVEVEKIVTQQVEKIVTKVVEKAVPVTVEKAVAKADFYGEVVTTNVDTPAAKFSVRVQGSNLVHYNGVAETLMRPAHQPPPTYNYEPGGYGLVDSWVIAPDGSKITMHIREGVQFHDGWGELTAQDVLWNFQECYVQVEGGAPCYSLAGLEMFIESMEAPDDRTFIIHVKDTGLVPDWHDGVLGPTAYQAVHMWSKKHFDEKGYDVAVNTAVGTGPFKVVEWVSDSHITLEPAFANHWRRTPNIARLTNREMQEASVILAALKTGEVHIGRIPLKFLGSTLKAIPGARTQQLGVPNLQTFIFGGNYWSTTDPATGKTEDAHGPINKRKGYKPDADHPWIGEWGNEASMENARKVREAMSIAIDRSTIVDKIQSGVGFPYFTNMNSHPGDAAWKDEWKISYNPERAKTLLAEAGYPNGFSFTTHVAPDREWAPEVGIAVAQYWRQIGLDVEVDSTTYLTARPQLVERSKDNPWMIHSGTGQKLHAAGVFHCCHKPTGGFSFGIEIPDEIWKIAALNNDITKTTEEERIANNQKIQDFFSSNFLTAPIAGLPNTAIVRPEIAEWTPYMAQTPLFNSPETITVARR